MTETPWTMSKDNWESRRKYLWFILRGGRETPVSQTYKEHLEIEREKRQKQDEQKYEQVIQNQIFNRSLNTWKYAQLPWWLKIWKLRLHQNITFQLLDWQEFVKSITTYSVGEATLPCIASKMNGDMTLLEGNLVLSNKITDLFASEPSVPL